MQTAVIIDAILAIVLIVCVFLGWRRGAFKSVIGIVVVVAALLGAGFVSQQCAPMAAEALTPVISHQIEARFEKAAQEVLPADSFAEEADAEGLFSAAGLYQRTARNMAESAAGQVKETGEAMIEAAVASMVQSVAAALLFLISFILLLIVLKVLSKFLGLLTAVPGLHLMDALGGGVFGLIQGCLVLFAVVWALQFFGGGVPEELVSQTVLLRFFAGMNPVGIVSGL